MGASSLARSFPCAKGERPKPSTRSPQNNSPLQIEQLPQPLRLRPAHRDLRLALVVHAQLVAGLEPWHHLADVVDIHHESTVGAPEQRWVQQFRSEKRRV